jgi:iron complex transport system substrate-binding protein
MKNLHRKPGEICLAAALLLGLLVSCTAMPENIPLKPTEIIDQLGRAVTLSAEGGPQRIVSLAPSNTEIVYALGLADRLVAVTDYDDYPPEVKQKPTIGGFSTPNIEVVVAMNPDLILATSIHKDKVIPQLEARGLTIVGLNPKTVDEVMASITMVGRVTGKQKEAASLITGMQQRLKTVTAKTEGLKAEQRPGTFYVLWHNPLMTAGAGTLQNELIKMAGGANIAAGLTNYADISLEAVLAANPDIIIAGDSMGKNQGQIFAVVSTDERLAETAARRSGRVYSIDANVVSRPGPRIVDGLEQFARFIHPELFK